MQPKGGFGDFPLLAESIYFPQKLLDSSHVFSLLILFYILEQLSKGGYKCQQ